ncbi:TSUP family transporter [Falsiroseomonas sp. HW251]|uniref:TSUP family transporter n=1 Tax=Falsiroseomonas sp. HW251 TaxID=3390998 RepID=UPI003D3133C1
MSRLTLISPWVLAVSSAVLIWLYAAALNILGLLSSGASTLALVAVLVAATVSSIAGFAFSAIAAAMLLPLMREPVEVVTIMLLSSIAIQSLSVWALRRAIDWHALFPMLVGGIMGLPIGVYLLLHLDTSQYARIMGVALVLYGAYMLFRKPLTVRGGRLHDALAGVAGGITGGLAAFPGALVTIWCSMKGWDKNRQRGVYQPYILIMQILTLVLLRTVTSGSWPGIAATAWTFVPAALMGTCCGLAIFKRLTDKQFGTAINVLLLVAGAGLIW